MIKINFNKKAVAFLSSGVFTFSLCSCSSDKKESISYSKNSFISTTSSFTDDVSSSDSYVQSSLGTTSFATTGNVITSDIDFTFDDNSKNIMSDSVVLGHFNDIISDIKVDNNSESFLDKGKRFLIYSVDFLFYDGDINGIKFSDLTSGAKEQLLSDIVDIDSLICLQFPNYKDTISDDMGIVFNKVMEIIKAGSRNIDDFSCEKLGEENYNKIGKYKDLFIDTAFGDWDKFTEVASDGKQKVKNWYETFRKNNQATTNGQN